MNETGAATLRAVVLQADELERQGDRRGAIEALRHALTLSPDFAQIHLHLGVLLQESDETEAALPHFERATALRPGDARAWNNLAAALTQLARLAEAEGAARSAVAADPNHGLAHYNLGCALFAQHRQEEARLALETAVRLHPANFGAWELLGRTCLELDRLERARDALLRATSGDPSRAPAWLSLASACLHSGRHEEAINALQRAEALDPPDAPQIASSRLIALHYDGTRGRDEIYEQHVAWARSYAPPPPVVRFANSKQADRRLRIGYVSPRFYESSIGNLLEPVLSNHDAGAVEVICYATRRTRNSLTPPLASRVAKWVEAWDLDDEALAQRMREDQIDIAVDLAGHTPGHRLLAFAKRPAPVCVAWLDYFNTTGLATMDYLVTDEWHSPTSDGQRFTENLRRLPRVRFCYQPPAEAPDVLPPPMVREGGPPVLGSFNRLAKLSPATLDAWGLALARIPGARLVIKNSSLNHVEERAAFASVLRERGVDTSRVEFRGQSNHAQMLAEYNHIDIVLDTFPYNGGITTMEALWMGKPVVTIRGDTLVSRQSSALLHAAGLQEFVASDRDQFVETISGLASNTTRLEALTLGMRERLRNSPLLDGRGLANVLETTYRSLWHRCLKFGTC